MTLEYPMDYPIFPSASELWNRELTGAKLVFNQISPRKILLAENRYPGNMSISLNEWRRQSKILAVHIRPGFHTVASGVCKAISVKIKTENL